MYLVATSKSCLRKMKMTINFLGVDGHWFDESCFYVYRVQLEGCPLAMYPFSGIRKQREWLRSWGMDEVEFNTASPWRDLKFAGKPSQLKRIQQTLRDSPEERIGG